MNMASFRRALVVGSRITLIVPALLVCGCSGVVGGDASVSGPGSACVAVRTGEWEFELITGGVVFFSFVGADLVQSGCFLAYGEGPIFEGDLMASTWSVYPEEGGSSFVGVFSGDPATTFSGTFTDYRGVTAAMTGRYVGR